MADYDEMYDEVDVDDGDVDEYYDDAPEREVNVRVGNGLDTFCLVFAVFLILGSIALLGYFVHYDIYGQRMGGIFPEKERPPGLSDVRVIAFGRDPWISDTYNYVLLNRGSAAGLMPGHVLEYRVEGDSGAGFKVIVSSEITPLAARADIYELSTPAMVRSNGFPQQSVTSTPIRMNDWTQILTRSRATEELPLLLPVTEDGPGLTVDTLPWGEQQLFLNNVRLQGHAWVLPKRD